MCAVYAPARSLRDPHEAKADVLQDPTKLLYSHQVTLQQAPDAWLLGYAASAMNELNAMRGKWHPDMIHRRSPAWSKWNSSPAELGFAPVSAFWYSGPKVSRKSKAPPRKAGEPILLAFHGGGYICGTAAETDATSLIYRNLVQYTAVKHVLSVDYRLADKSPWPVPLLDAISAYHHLVAVEGVDERDILLGGDSAGGHLAMALMRWIRDAGVQLGLRGPRALLLFSPWSDIGFTHVWGDKLLKHNLGSDIIHDTFGPFASGLLTRAMPPGTIHRDVYLSPASRLITPTASMFLDFPPMFITYGEAERITLEITDLYRRVQLARKVATPPVKDVLYKAPDSVHDFMIFPWFADESAVVLERLDEWLRELLGRDDSDDDVSVVAGLGSPAGLEPLGLASPAFELPPILDIAPPPSHSGCRLPPRPSSPHSHPSLRSRPTPRPTRLTSTICPPRPGDRGTSSAQPSERSKARKWCPSAIRPDSWSQTCATRAYTCSTFPTSISGARIALESRQTGWTTSSWTVAVTTTTTHMYTGTSMAGATTAMVTAMAMVAALARKAIPAPDRGAARRRQTLPAPRCSLVTNTVSQHAQAASPATHALL